MGRLFSRQWRALARRCRYLYCILFRPEKKPRIPAKPNIAGLVEHVGLLWVFGRQEECGDTLIIVQR